MSDRQFKVIIVGGSVTGLTLAHSLHKIGVDYAILEKRPSIAPREGASIGIFPNGARVLDQLGLYRAIEQATAPLGATHVHFQDGFSFNSPYPKKMLENFGYPIAFLERRKLLEILYDALPDKTRVHVNKAVSTISQYTEDGTGRVRVRTLDGQVCEGDIVVGADGVHSRTRSELWRLSSLSGQSAKDGSSLSVEYSCCFGISTRLPELRAGEQVMRIYNGRTLVVIPSKDGLVFWFLVQKLERRYEYGEAPHFTPEQAAAQCSQLADAPIGNNVQFGHVWQRRQTFNMVPLEENVFRTWSFGRLVCIGDSMHKMTVNLGQGANCAIEDVAVLSNLLHAQFKESKPKRPSDQEVGALLRHFNRLHLSRVDHICSMSWTITRVHALDGVGRKIAGRYLMPYFANHFKSRPFNMIADAAALDFVPLPRSSFPGWEKYKSKRGKIGSWTVVLQLFLLLVVMKIFIAYR